MAWGRYVHGLTVKGEQNVPQSGPALIIGIHTTHNTELYLGLSYICQVKKRVVRPMLHFAAEFLSPITNRFGGAPGSKELAVELLRAGHVVGIIPGGLEETFLHLTNNGADCYSPLWESKDGVPRCGFARVALAMGAGFRVLPCVFQNGEEMRWNALFSVWSWLALDVVYGRLTRRSPRPLRLALYWIGLYTWSVLSLPLFSFTVPVKVTCHVGEAVAVREGETAEELRERVRAALLAIVHTTQRRTHRSFWDGIHQRWRQLNCSL